MRRAIRAIQCRIGWNRVSISVAAWVCAGVCAFVVGRSDASALQDLRPGRWYEIPNSDLGSIAVATGGGGSIRRLTAWSGAALDPTANRLLVWGGGHGDYAGNEVYCFDLDALKWTRLSEPGHADDGRDATYPDGSPRARHTYNYIEFLPELGHLLSFGGAALFPFGDSHTRTIAEFDPRSGVWVLGRRADVPAGGNMLGAQARRDPVTGDVFFLPSQKASLARYSVRQDRWSGGWPSTYIRVHATAALDWKRRQMVLIGSGTDKPQAYAWNLDRPGPARDLRELTRGDVEIERAYAPGFDFHSPSGKFVAWSGGSDVYVLDPENWTWSRRLAAADNSAVPALPLGTGTYGRFRYVPKLDLFVLMNGVERNVFVYRLAPE